MIIYKKLYHHIIEFFFLTTDYYSWFNIKKKYLDSQN